MRGSLAIILGSSLLVGGCTPTKSPRVQQQDAAVPELLDAGPPPAVGCGSLDDVRHCGACATDCTKMPHVAVAGCVNRVCVALSCNPLRGHCSSNPLDGCEIDFTTDDHCGSCELSCTKAHGICTTAGGPPICACPGSQHLCGGSCVENGEAACGPQCEVCMGPPSHGVAHCAGDVCQVKCEDGYHAVGQNCEVGAYPPSFATWGGTNWYKVMVTGTMTDANVMAACKAVGLTVPCQAAGTCQYNNNLCKMQTAETSCGNPMKGLAVSLGCSSPANCAQLNGVFQYMGGMWHGASCGSLAGSWCSDGSSTQNQSALCVEP